MANRLEIVAGWDLIRRVNIMNHWWLTTAYYLQYPTGDIAQKLFVEAQRNINHVAFVATNTQFLLGKSGYSNAAFQGLSYFNASASDIDEDCIGVVSMKSYTDTNMIDDDQNIKEVAEYMETECIKQKFDTSTPQIFQGSLHAITDCHDLLDAMMYELRGINSHSGNAHGKDFVSIMDLMSKRCFSLDIRLAVVTGYTDDLAVIKPLRDTVVKDLGLAKDNNDLLAIAQKIEDGIPRLVLWRRWWSF